MPQLVAASPRPAPTPSKTIPPPAKATHTLRDFKFHTGEVMPELKMPIARLASRPASR